MLIKGKLMCVIVKYWGITWGFNPVPLVYSNGAVKVALIIVYDFNGTDNPKPQWKLNGKSV